ncbi:hypothetical protein PTKIN_Ptkin01aG0112300 [Pterospermum kingtungense]
MGAKASRIDNMNDLFLVETYAAIKALELAFKRGCKETTLEGDALCIIKRLQSSTEDRSILSHLTEKGSKKITCFFKCEIKHCPRNCNEVVDQLEKLGTNTVEECIWIENYPACIKNFVNVKM